MSASSISNRLPASMSRFWRKSILIVQQVLEVLQVFFQRFQSFLHRGFASRTGRHRLPCFSWSAATVRSSPVSDHSTSAWVSYKPSYAPGMRRPFPASPFNCSFLQIRCTQSIRAIWEAWVICWSDGFSWSFNDQMMDKSLISDIRLVFDCLGIPPLYLRTCDFLTCQLASLSSPGRFSPGSR
jgi:hypothetical protein